MCAACRSCRRMNAVALCAVTRRGRSTGIELTWFAGMCSKHLRACMCQVAFCGACIGSCALWSMAIRLVMTARLASCLLSIRKMHAIAVRTPRRRAGSPAPGWPCCCTVMVGRWLFQLCFGWVIVINNTRARLMAAPQLMQRAAAASALQQLFGCRTRARVRVGALSSTVSRTSGRTRQMAAFD